MGENILEGMKGRYATTQNIVGGAVVVVGGLALIVATATPAHAITNEQAASVDSVFAMEQFGEDNYTQSDRVMFSDPNTGEWALVPTMVATNHDGLYHPIEVLAWADADSVTGEQSRIAAADPYRVLKEFYLDQIPTTYAYRDSLESFVGQYFTLDVDNGLMPVIPDEVSLSQNYSNPFNTGTTLEYSIREKGNVWLRVYDIHGRRVAELVNGRHSPGKYTLQWNPDLASGHYIARLHASGTTKTMKMVLQK